MANQWGDEPAQTNAWGDEPAPASDSAATAIELRPGEPLPTNAWGDSLAADVVVRRGTPAAPAPAAPSVAGNIDLTNRPRVKNADGSVSTVRSVSFGTDQGEVLLPTVMDNGTVVSDQEALANYQRTGKHLGIFKSPDEANAYAEWLHNQQAAQLESDATAITPRDQLQPRGRSTVTGLTPNEAQARGEAGMQRLKEDAASVAAPALRVGGPMAGVALAPFTGLASLPAGVALGTIGSALAEPVAQQLEIIAKERDKASWDEGVLNVASGGPLAGLGVPFANRAGAGLASRILQTGWRAAEGGAISTAQGALQRGAAAQPITLKSLASDFAPGALLGGIIGTSFDELARSKRLDQAYTAARQMGFAGETEAELRTWWNANAATQKQAARWRNREGSIDITEPSPSSTPTPPEGTPAQPPAALTAPPAEIPPSSRPSAPTAAAEAPPITPEQYRATSRTERLGTLARLSDDQLAALSDQMGLAPRAAPVAALPSSQVSGLKSQASSAVTAPAANSFAELSTLWNDAGVKLAVEPAKEGVVRVSALEVPEAQRGQGLGSFILKDVRDVSDVTGQTVEIPAPTGPEAARQTAWLEREGFKPYGRKAADGSTAWRYAPASRPKGPRPGFGSRADGSVDLIDFIGQLGGVPKRPTDAAGKGEWDGWDETFQGPARMLVRGGTGGKIDTFVKELNEIGGFNFQTPDDFYSAVGVAIEGRKRLKTAVDREQAIGKFYDAALDNRGRAPGETADTPIGIDDLAPGDRFKIKGEEIRVTALDEDGNLTVTGPRIGEQTLPAGQLLHHDKGSLMRSEPAAPAVNAWGDEAAEGMPDNSATNNEPAEGRSQLTITPGKDHWRRPSIELSFTIKGGGRAEASIRTRDNGDGKELRLIDWSATPISQIASRGLRAEQDYKGKGFGRQALYSLLSEARRNGANTLTVFAPTNDTKAVLNHYTQTGLFTAGTEKDLTGFPAEFSINYEQLSDLAPSPQPRASSTANASPGSASAEAYPGPEAFTPEPVNDPTFSQLPAELPEAIQFYRALSGGQYPKIREKIRLLQGQALGVFRHTDAAGTHSLELRADIFRLVSKQEKARLAAEAFTWARAMHESGTSSVPIKDLAEARFNDLVRAAEQKALTENPKQALAVLWHEIGHYVDWMPDNTLKRGNILGHIAGFKNHLKGFLAENPGISPTPVPPNANERAKLHRQAEKELRAQVTETVETIRREEPVYRQIPITADNITSILKNAQRDEFPALYDWFTQLDRADKAAVLRAAMKGVVKAPADTFTRREPTGEMRTVEEIKRTKTGKEPTADEIRARFDELLRAEFKRRGLISQRDIRTEADTVIKWWQGVDAVPDYFKTATETWAEVFSAMMNNPAGVAKRAPTFWRAFQAYLVNRPEVAKVYREMQDSIKSGAVHRERVMNLRESWHRDEDNSLLADSMFSTFDLTNLRDTLSLLFNRQTGPIQRRALDLLKREPGNRAAVDALSALKNYLYRATGWESFARDLNLHVEAPLAAAGLHHDDLSEFLFHSRIAKGDRQQLANPLGWSPKTSAERLAAMQADLGPDRWAVLEESAATFRSIYEEQVIPLLKESGMLTPELEQIIEDRTLYATFAKAREFNPLEAGTLQGALENRYGKDVTARIYRQIGHLGEIRSPYLATVQKAFSLISTARRQIALKAIARFIEETEPQNIIPAQERFTNGRMEPVPMETRHVGTLYTLNRGKVEAFYVPRVYTEMMSHGSPLESQILGLAHKALAWPKAILTELNPGFWPVAFAKDVATLAIQLPKGARSLKQLPAAYSAAKAAMTSQPSPLADAALRRLMVISRADSRGEHLGHADEISRILLRMGQEPRLWDAEAEKIGRFLRFWMAWKRQGQTLERTIKFAGMKHLDEAFPDMPEWEKKRIVNEQAGSPDFLEKGRAAPLVDLWMMFYNPWLRGLEAMKTSAQGDPRGFWTKFLATVGLAGTAYWMFEQGMIDGGLSKEEAEDKRDMMRSIPERDKRRGFAVPLWWSDKEQGKVAYIVLPFPDSLRYLHTGQRTLLQALSKDGSAAEGFQSFLNYQGQDLPGQNPMLTEAGKWYDYHVLGRNPYDAFLGRGALPEDMVTAHQGGTELALQTLSNVTGGVVYRHRQDRPGEAPTDLEQFMQTPMVGNLIGRWLRVSNRGLMEEADRDVAATRQREAELRLIGEDMVGRQMRGEPWSASQQELFSAEPYLAQRVIDRQVSIMSQATAPEMKAWQSAKSIGEKQALMEAWLKRETEKADRLKK